MSTLEWVIIGMSVMNAATAILLVSSAARARRIAWELWKAEHPTPTAETHSPTGTELKHYSEQTYTIPGETTNRWEIGDEIVAVTTELGTVVLSKAYAERMDIKGKPGKVVEG